MQVKDCLHAIKWRRHKVWWMWVRKPMKFIAHQIIKKGVYMHIHIHYQATILQIPHQFFNGGHGVYAYVKNIYWTTFHGGNHKPKVLRFAFIVPHSLSLSLEYASSKICTVHQTGMKQKASRWTNKIPVTIVKHIEHPNDITLEMPLL